MTNSKRAGPSGRCATPSALARCSGASSSAPSIGLRRHAGEQHVAARRVEAAGQGVQLVDRADGLRRVAVLLQPAPRVERDRPRLPQRPGRALDVGGRHAGDRLGHGRRHAAALLGDQVEHGRHGSVPGRVATSRTPNSAEPLLVDRVAAAGRVIGDRVARLLVPGDVVLRIARRGQLVAAAGGRCRRGRAAARWSSGGRSPRRTSRARSSRG